MRQARRRHGGLGFLRVLGLLLGVGILLPACSDNSGPVGPSGRQGKVDTTGTADTAAQIVVQVAINPNTIEIGRRAGITVLVTNFNGFPLADRHVQLSTNVGEIDVVDGRTNAQGQFIAFIAIRAGDVVNAAGLTAATVTAFVDGAIGTGTVNFGQPATLVLSPTTAAQTIQAVGASPGTCATLGGFTVQFTVSGGVPPYTFTSAGISSLAGLVGTSVNSSGLYTVPVFVGPFGGNTFFTDTVTVVDRQGASLTATVTVTCKPS